MSMHPLLYTFYGDDFTGSTDVLEQLALHGIEAALFLAPPQPEDLARFPGLRALGVASDARSRSPQWMDEHLPERFAALRAFGAPVTHYKVCSTFDSSPGVGSIGRALEIGLRVFAPRFAPVVVGAPHLRRYVHEGKLFAVAPDGAIHRIDRHPMSRHPVTPMREPDLALHLAKQTAEPIGRVEHVDLASAVKAREALHSQLSEGCRIVLFDTVDEPSLACLGKLLWDEARKQTLFSASSSGLTTALIHAWQATGLVAGAGPRAPITRSSPLLVLSGSCAAATSRQIEWALGHGFDGVRLDPVRWLADDAATAQEETMLRLAALLREGRDVVVYTALGEAETEPQGAALGEALGRLAQRLLAETPVQRVVFCGGDTSSHAVQQMGVVALTWLASLDPGAPLCLAHREAPDAPRLELILKGGQVGGEDFFARARGD